MKHWGWKWAGVILAAGLLDLAVRLLVGFEMPWVVRVEAVLFSGTAFTLWTFRTSGDARGRWRSRIQVGLISLFALGALRAALLAVSVPVARSNLVVTVVALLLIAEAVRRRKRNAGRDPAGG